MTQRTLRDLNTSDTAFADMTTNPVKRKRRSRKPKTFAFEFKLIKRQRFLNDCYLLNLRTVNAIYLHYGGDPTLNWKVKARDRLYIEIVKMVELLMKRKSMYRRSGYPKGTSGGLYVKRSAVPDPILRKAYVTKKLEQRKQQRTDHKA